MISEKITNTLIHNKTHLKVGFARKYLWYSEAPLPDQA